MKKIIATALCLTLATPCFAASRYHDKYPNRGFHNHKHQCLTDVRIMTITKDIIIQELQKEQEQLVQLQGLLVSQ